MPKKILVCQHRTCPMQGSTSVLEAFRVQSPFNIAVESTGCLGECGSGPMVVILPEEIWYCNVQPEDVYKIVEQHLKGGEPVREKLYPKFHPPKQSLPIWFFTLILMLFFFGLLTWLIVSQTYYF